MSQDRRIPERESATPGPRTTITLNIAEHSIPVLLEGIHPSRVWFVDEGDGVYGFHATQTLGETRHQPGRPAADLLTDIANDLADLLDHPDVPDHLRAVRDGIVDSYIEQTARTTEPGT